MTRFILVALISLAGCATTGQGYIDSSVETRHYASDGSVMSVITETTNTVKNRTIAPPFGSKASASHEMLAEISPDGAFHLEMGSVGELEGGDISMLVNALAVLAQRIEELVRATHPLLAPLAILEPEDAQ